MGIALGVASSAFGLSVFSSSALSIVVWGTVLLLLSIWAGLNIWRLTQNNVIRFVYRKDAPHFLKRNKDQLALLVITALISAAIGAASALAGKWLWYALTPQPSQQDDAPAAVAPDHPPEPTSDAGSP